MELTAPRLLLAALPVFALFLIGVPTESDAQRIVSFPLAAGYATRKDRGRGEFPRKGELLQALNFLEEYERGKENDWINDLDIDGALYEDVGRNTFKSEDNDIYPPDFDLDRDEFRQEDQLPEYVPNEGNSVDIQPWIAEYLLRGGTEEEEPEDLWGVDDDELLEIALEEEIAEEADEAKEEAYVEEVEREEEKEIADIVEEEMEDMAVDDILDDLWAEEMLQEDAEKQLKWLLVEEEDNMQREEEEEEDDEDPFQFEYFYSDGYLAGRPVSGEEDGPSFLEGIGDGLGSDYAAEYLMGSSLEDYPGESLDDDEREELMEEANEVLDLQDAEDEEEDSEQRARGFLNYLLTSLTREAIQEELEEENAEEGYEDAGDDDDGDVKEGGLSSSVLDAGMGDEETAQIEEEEEEVDKEVYSELIEFLEDEINRAIEDVADDILQGLVESEEEEEAAEGAYEEEEDDYGSMWAASTEEEHLTSEWAEVEPDDGDVCSSLQYFIDDCNIVNNYADLGADGYKDLFVGACNRHQLCYACGEYYDVGTKLCDELFKAEMLTRCEADDPDCKQRAKYFWLVARNNRIPDLKPPPICADPCLLDFLVDV